MWVKCLTGTAYALRNAIGSHTIDGYPDIQGSPYSKRAVRALRGVLPYCLHPIKDTDGEQLIWLNRDYKPLGLMPYEDWVEYADFRWLHVHRNDARIRNLLVSCAQTPATRGGGGVFYLFNDLTAPTNGKARAKALLAKIDEVLARSGVETLY